MSHKQKILALLSDGRTHTHHELYALGCVAHSRISDLRREGHVIEMWREGDDYLYRLASSALDERGPQADGGRPAAVPVASESTVASVSPRSSSAEQLALLEAEPARGAYSEVA